MLETNTRTKSNMTTAKVSLPTFGSSIYSSSDCACVCVQVRMGFMAILPFLRTHSKRPKRHFSPEFIHFLPMICVRFSTLDTAYMGKEFELFS